MLKYILVFMIFISFNASAQMQFHDETIEVEIAAPLIKPSEDTNLPNCNDQRIYNQVLEKIKDYLAQNPVNDIINNRKRILMLKNLKSFSEILIKEFDNATNHYVASEMVMTKINHNMSDKDMRLCIDNNKFIYLLIYPEGEQRFRVQIINFIAPGPKGNRFSFLYVPQELQDIDK